MSDTGPHRGPSRRRKGIPERASPFGTGLALLIALAILPVAATTSPVVPAPAQIAAQPGNLKIDAGTRIAIPAGDPGARRAADFLADLVRRSHRVELTLANGKVAGPAIRFVRDARRVAAPEAYRIEAGPTGATVTAGGDAGLLYGAVTVWQSLSSDATLPGLLIEDAPRFAWRGLMLDSARHFQSPEFIRRFIDAMAIHKLNVLHWHLTDDQAWRLEIKRHPRLTGVGAWRVPAGAAPLADIDAATGKPRLYGGFYSQQTVREIVRYAAGRGITIVPEIELPGHASAALAAYPALAATREPPTTASHDWGIHANVYNVEEATFTFLQEVLTEVMALFPGRYIHVGGDEVLKQQWEESTAVQTRMRALGVASTASLQTYFTQRIARFLNRHGRRLVGWDEILEPGIPKGSTVMSWRGIDGALKAAREGFDTVLSPWPTLYFDNLQRFAADEPPGRGRLIALKDVYGFEPMPPALDAAQRRHVLGLQANLWTEHIRTEDRVGHMAFPRAAAVAELGWSPPERRDWNTFLARLPNLIGRYRALGIPFADSALAVDGDIDAGAASTRVRLSTQAGIGEIRYTLDGSAPTAQSALYRDALALPAPVAPLLRAAAFADGRALSEPRDFALGREPATRRSSQQLTLCTENIALSVEDDAPIGGKRAALLLDVGNPCWIYKDVELGALRGVRTSVGQVPFNFQIGEDVKKIKFAPPTTPDGELEVRVGTCEGHLLARLSLAPARHSHAVTVLPDAAVTLPAATPARGDLCFRFAQRFEDWTRDPVWALDWVQLLLSEAKP